jgi:hypothetical protein
MQGARTQATPSQSTFQGCLDRLAIANPCYERGVAYINAAAATQLHRLTRLIPLKPGSSSYSGSQTWVFHYTTEEDPGVGRVVDPCMS